MILTEENAAKIFEDENYKEREVLTIPRRVTVISAVALRECKARQVYISDSVKKIESYAFADMKNLKSIYIPESVEKLCSFAFANSNIKFVNISSRTEVTRDTFSLTRKLVVVSYRY